MLAGREVLGIAPTGSSASTGVVLTKAGSGKTMAYAVPILSHLQKPKSVGFRACIVSPTRELAQQVMKRWICFLPLMLQQIKRECDRLNEGMNLKIKILDKSNPAKRHAFLRQNSMKLGLPDLGCSCAHPP
jgi:ATP-dependent RNA helicase DDX52/ROK1